MSFQDNSTENGLNDATTINLVISMETGGLSGARDIVDDRLVDRFYTSGN